jgi:hypothetical protein
MEKIAIRRIDSRFQIERLERRHHALKEQIAELDGHRYLTVAEQLLVHELKKERLATKDLLVGLRRRVTSD